MCGGDLQAAECHEPVTIGMLAFILKKANWDPLELLICLSKILGWLHPVLLDLNPNLRASACTTALSSLLYPAEKVSSAGGRHLVLNAS